MNLKFLIFLFLNFSISIKGIGQIERSFLKAYNQHVDPACRIDSLTIFSVKMSIDATAIINSSPFEVHNYMECIYFADGSEHLKDEKSATQISSSFIPATRKKFKNSIKDRLGLISTAESIDLKLKYLSDSITVIEEHVNEFQSFTYTFNSKTKDLLQIENFAKKETRIYHSFTNFLSYQIIDGILVPNEIRFTNDFATAKVRFLNPTFQ
jgi:hypothetical protein